MSDDLPKDLTEGEKRFVNQMIKDEPQWISWVRKTNRREAVQSRLLVIGKYRIYSIKRNKMGKKQIVREGHIFDLKEIISDDLDKVVLSFGTFKIVAQSQNLGVELPKVILQCFQQISFTFSEAATPKLTLEPIGRAVPVLDPVYPGIAGGFLEVYHAYCDYYNLPPSNDVILHVEDVALSGSRAFNLDGVTGIERESDLVPVVAALRHNTYFTTLTMHEKSRKEAVSSIADILTHNTTLTAIDISGVEADEGWIQLGEALKGNPRNSLLDLNISSNCIGEKGIIPLTVGLTAVGHPMSSLFISNVELQGKGSVLLVRALASNMPLSNTLCELDVSKNVLSNPGSLALADWILQLSELQPGTIDKKYLRKILCSSTQLEVAPVLDAIKSSLPNTIEDLDISDNKFEDYGNQILVALISRSHSLTNINLAGCELNGKIIREMLGAITQSNLSDVMLDLSRNDMSQEITSLSFAKSVEECARIHTLVLSELNLKKEPLLGLIRAIGTNKTLKGIDLSGNFKHNAKSETMESIALAVLGHPTLTYLAVAGRKDNYVGKEIIPLFKVISGTSKLLELDVRDNIFLDDGARALFDALRHNSYLKTVNFDGNSIGWAGCQALRRCMNVNRSLTSVHYPKKDVTRIIANSRDKDRVNIQEKLRELFNYVAVVCTTNKTAQSTNPQVVECRPLTAMLSTQTPQSNPTPSSYMPPEPPAVYSEYSPSSHPPSVYGMPAQPFYGSSMGSNSFLNTGEPLTTRVPPPPPSGSSLSLSYSTPPPSSGSSLSLGYGTPPPPSSGSSLSIGYSMPPPTSGSSLSLGYGMPPATSGSSLSLSYNMPPPTDTSRVPPPPPNIQRPPPPPPPTSGSSLSFGYSMPPPPVPNSGQDNEYQYDGDGYDDEFEDLTTSTHNRYSRMPVASSSSSS